MRGEQLLLGLVGLTGCMTYQPGSFAVGPALMAGEKATVGCLDVAIERRDDHDKSTVLAYWFGNRCERPALVNLAAPRVIGRDAEGGEHVLRPFDPKAQIVPQYLDTGLTGREAIAYVADDALGVEMIQVCVDASGLAQGQPTRWMCFAQTPKLPAEEPAEAPTLVHEEAA